MRKERQSTFQEQGKEPVIDRISLLVRRHPSRSAAARAWGVNINTLNSYFKTEKDSPMPRDNLLSRIAESEGVSLEWLRSGQGETPVKHEKHESDGDGLTEILSFLTRDERRQLTAMLARKGVETILYLLDEDNIALLKLDKVVKEKILGKQPQTEAVANHNYEKAKECGADNEERADTESLASDKKRAV
ncbi:MULTISPECIES: hypothetical protein [Serratia]|uniref:hypothetical protein n=1 Tax=Serratia TaxID=613 RepID=UPI0006605247|nr:hypothetical protein [Serratia sp. 506_PEND]